MSHFQVAVVQRPLVMEIPCSTNRECVTTARAEIRKWSNNVAGTQVHIQAKRADGSWQTLVEYDFEKSGAWVQRLR